MKRCPRCNAYVDVKYVDTAGEHWVCPICGRNSQSYTLVYDTNTQMYNEIKVQKEKSK